MCWRMLDAGHNVMVVPMKKLSVQPYLSFGGQCEEAVKFYQEVLGAEVEMMMRFSESPEPLPEEMQAAELQDKIMHATFRVGESVVMASDGCGGEAEFKGFHLSIGVEDKDDATRIFNQLSDGGNVQMPLLPTFWAPLFGMVSDKYGVGWMVSVIPEEKMG